MAGPAWLIDGSRIATKIKNASGTESESCDLSRADKLQSNPTITCPRCSHIIDNSDVSQEWPGLPKGVKFDPSDSDLLLHLLAKSGKCGTNPHPWINEFISTLEGWDGICCTHPQKLPGVKQDGSVSHFFHKTFKAYNTGTRKRRKIHNDGHLGDMCWHKTGKTRPIVVDGAQQGCKKIMVLYAKGGKSEKTNWVMHQYHLGTGENEKDGEYVVSKIFYQQPQQSKQNDINELDAENLKTHEIKNVTPEHLEHPTEKRHRSLDCEQTTGVVPADWELDILEVEIIDDGENHHVGNNNILNDFENYDVGTYNIVDDDEKHHVGNNTIVTDGENHQVGNDSAIVGDGENHHVGNNAIMDDGGKNDSQSQDDSPVDSQLIWNSQQLADGMALCDEFLLSQPSRGGGNVEDNKPCLADYAQLGPENLKTDLEECKRLNSIDNQDIVLDTPPSDKDRRLSQLEFDSQESVLGWG